MTDLHTKTKTHDIDLITLLKILREKKWFILATGFIVFAISMTYVYFKPVKYQANILLQLQQKQYNNLSALAKNNQATDIKTALEEPIPVQLGLIRSRFILEPLIHELGLDIDATPIKKLSINRVFHNNHNKISVSALQVPTKLQNKKLRIVAEKNQYYRLYDAKNKLVLQGKIGETASSQHGISIKVDALKGAPGSEFYLIKKTETEVLRNILSNLSITDLSNQTDNANNKIAILQLSLIGNNPKTITKILNKIAVISQQKSIERKFYHINKSLAFLNHELPIAKQSLQEAESRLNEYRSTSKQADIKLQTQSLLNHLTQIDKQIDELSAKKASLAQAYTEDYPFARSLNAKIAELKAQYNKVYNQLKSLPAADQAVSSINRDINVRNNLYLALLNQIHELQVIKAGLASDVHILLMETTPEVHMPIKMSVVAIISIITGILLGSFLVMIMSMFSSTRKQ